MARLLLVDSWFLASFYSCSTGCLSSVAPSSGGQIWLATDDKIQRQQRQQQQQQHSSRSIKVKISSSSLSLSLCLSTFPGGFIKNLLATWQFPACCFVFIALLLARFLALALWRKKTGDKERNWLCQRRSGLLRAPSAQLGVAASTQRSYSRVVFLVRLSELL